ncbi:hypothetical protein [Acetobacter senegalensis]
MAIHANIIDITKDIPQKNDVFIIDTNAWIWATYTRATYSANKYQTDYYPSYIDKIIECGAKIFRTSFVLIEISHVIETIECDIFRTKNSLPDLSLKKYRHYADTENVKKEITSAWEQICSMSDQLDMVMNCQFNAKLLDLVQNENVDGYDRSLILAAKSNGLRILSDDIDIASVKSITLHTANSKVVTSSLAAGKLLPSRL